MKVNIPEPIRHPLTGLLSFIGTAWGVANAEVLLSLVKAVFASAPQIFTGVTVGALTFPEFWPPATPADWAGVAATGLFALYLLYKINQNFDENGL